MPKFIEAVALKKSLHDGAEFALLDVREHGQYGESHILLAVPLPYSRLELEIERLVPRKSVRVVLVDDDESIATRAASRLIKMGYSAVQVLRGGISSWRAAGYALFAGVNVVSKTFGELAEHFYHTPRMSARDLANMQARGDDLVVLDGRPYTEYRKMNIPGAICCPNGELAYRLHDVVKSDTTKIVINCAGRTRSIIGAQTLINLGIKNPVYALENGTQGWVLSDLALEHGSARCYPNSDTPARLDEARHAAAALASRLGVNSIDAATLATWLNDPHRTTFLCDLRTPEEFLLGSLPGAQHTPGGQLIQATDQYIGVRNARLVLLDTDGVRAPVVASWLGQMGYEAVVLEGGLDSGFNTKTHARNPINLLPEIAPEALAAGLVQGSFAAIDLRPSMHYRAAHIPGAVWSIRPRIGTQLAGEKRPLVLIADDPEVAALVALDLDEVQRSHAKVLRGGITAWRAAGRPVSSDANSPANADCIDYLFFVHDRHDGNKDAARRYLAWETGLLAQIDEDERAMFRFPHSFSDLNR